MKSRTGQHATFGHSSLSEAFAAEAVDKLQNYYLPWIREALEQINDDIAWSRPNARVNSIGNLLLHLEGNIRQWMISGLGGEPDRRERDAEFAAEGGISRWTLYDKLKATVDDACRVIQQPRDDADWLREITIQGFTTTPVSAVVHVVEHFSYHTGQIVQLTKAATGKDLKFYEL